MNKQVAINIIKFLNSVTLTGHNEREAMNEACATLLEIVNAKEPDTQETKEAEGKANSK
jgi:hypothetical protein